MQPPAGLRARHHQRWTKQGEDTSIAVNVGLHVKPVQPFHDLLQPLLFPRQLLTGGNDIRLVLEEVFRTCIRIAFPDSESLVERPMDILIKGAQEIMVNDARQVVNDPLRYECNYQTKRSKRELI